MLVEIGQAADDDRPYHRDQRTGDSARHPGCDQDNQDDSRGHCEVLRTSMWKCLGGSRHEPTAGLRPVLGTPIMSGPADGDLNAEARQEAHEDRPDKKLARNPAELQASSRPPSEER
jgi:hypothetical protein